MRPAPPPPPPNNKRDSTTIGDNNRESSISTANNNELARPPPPPPPKRASSSFNPQPMQEPLVDNEISRPVAPPPPKRPPRPSEVKTVPVEQALESVLATNENEEEENFEYHKSNYSNVAPRSPTEAEYIASNNNKRSSTTQPTSTTVVVNPSYASRSTVSNNSGPNHNDLEDSTSSEGNGSAKILVGKPNTFASQGEPNNMIYHKNTYSELWLGIFLFIHTGQFILLLAAASSQIPSAALAIIIILVISVIILTAGSRYFVKKSKLSQARNVEVRGGICTPEDEADEIPDISIHMLSLACVCEGIAYAIFAATVAGLRNHLDSTGFKTQGTILQVLRFASITLLALHRIIRPANRIDPMRTILELEVVAVCWDAIDGSTVFELLDGNPIGHSTEAAARTLMAIWYVSVGVRMALMFASHLTPTSSVYSLFVTAPLQLAPQPTVDRTLQGLRLRAIVIMTMAMADIYAAVLRCVLWARGELNTLQQEMVIKNFLFLAACSGAYDMYTCTITRNWNSRLIDFVFFTVQYPKRETQLIWLRWCFVATYMLISILLSVILINVAPASNTWAANIVLDAILCLIFVVYCRNVSYKADFHEPIWFFIPKERFFSFPFTLATVLGGCMAVSLLFGRIPALYYNYNNMASATVLWTYPNALLLVSLAILPIAFYSMYWSTGYMLFRKEFTAVPGNYNAIHDPVIQMMATATMTEGALDILSCATLMQLAQNSLPSNVNGAVVLFCLLEVFNGCQSMALQVTLSGGHDDTPLDLVRWNAYLRVFRVLVDSGAIILRVVLWIQYNAVSSVFLVKNIYNLIHTVTQIGRWQGVTRYPKDTLFSQFVPAQDWYGLSMEQWRKCTSETIAAQARAGRRV